MEKTLKKLKIGTYQFDPDAEEWDVKIDEKSYFSCKSQIEAEILSTLVRIERHLNKISGVERDGQATD